MFFGNLKKWDFCMEMWKTGDLEEKKLDEGERRDWDGIEWR